MLQYDTRSQPPHDIDVGVLHTVRVIEDELPSELMTTMRRARTIWVQCAGGEAGGGGE